MTEPNGEAASKLHLARHWLEVGRPERCLETLRAGDPAGMTIEAFELRAAALIELDRHVEAAAEARRGLTTDPENRQLLALLGMACRSTGELAEGERALLHALRNDPNDAWLLAQYALLLASGGELTKATRVAQRAADLDPTEPMVARTRALIAHIEGRDSDAAAIARSTVSSDPDDVGGHALLGAFSLEEGRIGAGAKHLRTAASIDPRGDIADVAREATVLAHPALLPIRWLYRFGPAKVWLGAIAIIGVLTAVGWELAAAIAGGAYLVVAVYSWVAPPLVRRWVRWRR